MCARGELAKQANNMEPQIQASQPEKVTTYQPLSQQTRGIGDLEGVPDTRGGGSVLEAPPGAEEGALPRERRPVRHLKQLTRF